MDREMYLKNKNKTHKVNCLHPSVPYYYEYYQISQLPMNIRKEFLLDFWFNALPSSAHVRAMVEKFFAEVEEVEVDFSQKLPKLIYHTTQGNSCYEGFPPLKNNELDSLVKEIEFQLPDDFLKFFRVHNGFKKRGVGELVHSNTLRFALCNSNYNTKKLPIAFFLSSKEQFNGYFLIRSGMAQIQSSGLHIQETQSVKCSIICNDEMHNTFSEWFLQRLIFD